LAFFLVAVFVAGLTALLVMRFERGDVYPPYSSLRSDPLGTRVLFESLKALAPDTARRWHRPPDQVDLNPATTFLICGFGSDLSAMRGRLWERLLDRLAGDGGRVVITFGDRAQGKAEADSDSQEETEAVTDEKQTAQENDTTSDTPSDEGVDETGDEAADEAEADIWTATEDLGIQLDATRRQGERPVACLSASAPDADLAPTLPWRGVQFFQIQDEAWQAVYYIDQAGQPVIVRRTWGRGELVLLADSFLLSNEALRNERATVLLTWLLPPGQHIIFDEFHHGIARQDGIATLARKYGLEGIFGVLVFVGMLFVWRQSATFVPPVVDPHRSDENGAIVGSDSGQALVGLMRQHIPAKRLVSICFQTWLASPAARHVSSQRIAEARQWLEEQGTDRHDPVAVYHHIAKLLNQRKHL
jgi:hypothetical protein